jgi:hypothetical protein
MSIKSLLAASLTLIVCAVPLVAQSNRTSNIAAAAAATPAYSQDNVTHIPSMAGKKDLGVVNTKRTANIQRAIALDGLTRMNPKIQLKGNLAMNDNTCFALREKRFRAPDVASNMPQPNGSATCTPASELHRKQADMESAGR